jgi:hypothetical protein
MIHVVAMISPRTLALPLRSHDLTRAKLHLHVTALEQPKAHLESNRMKTFPRIVRTHAARFSSFSAASLM